MRATVVIPVLNEAERLAGCLDAVAAQDVPQADIEVLVVDGGSTDGTVDMACRLLAGRGWARAEVLHSPAGDRSSNLNCGLFAATAPILVRIDARSRIPSHYVRRCLEVLDRRPDVAVVGGRQRAVAAGTGAVYAGMVRALNNRWGMGLARYRRGGASGEAETVYLGAFRTTQLRAAGGWRTDLAVNEDFDVNRRLARFGLVWFDAGLVVDYVPRASLGALARQYWAFGTGKARYWRLSGDRPMPRQLVLLTAPVATLLGLAASALALGPTGTGLLLAAGLAGAVTIEGGGADDPSAGLAGHLTAVTALAVVAAAWWTGVVYELVRQALAPASAARPLERAP